MLSITHNCGFFSCCSVRISTIIQFFSKNKCLPTQIDSSKQFSMYKIDENVDITYNFFENYVNVNEEIIYKNKIHIDDYNFQFDNYKNVDYKSVVPFVKKYFKPSCEVLNKVNTLLLKYNIDTTNCIGLYFRGTDKVRETLIDSFDVYYNKLNEIINLNKNIQIIIQTDSAQFLDYIKNKSISNIIVITENSVSYTDRGIHNEKPQGENYIDIHNLFATFLIISKCKYVICSSGNCSIWIMYYREHSNNIYQNLNKVWL